MNVNLLVKGIKSIIPGGISAKDFAIIASINESEAEKILDMLAQNNIGKINGQLINFEDDDKLKAVIFAIKNAAPIEEVSFRC